MIAGIKRLSFGETDSTQNYLESWLQREVLPEGTLVVADYQVNGKGIVGEWNSEPGKNLLFSVLFYPEFLLAQDVFFLNKISALALYQTIRILDSTLKVSIKWPNDILIDSQKTAGIIIRNQISGENIKTSIWGIGLNVNQGAFQEGITKSPTSLKIKTGKNWERETVLRELCKQMDYYYLALKNGKREEIDMEFISALFGWGEDRSFVWDGETHLGRIIGLDSFGRIEIQTKSGSRFFAMKEIRFII